MRVHASGCKQLLWPFISQLHGLLATLGAGAGNDHLAYAGLKCCFNNLFSIDIE